MKRYYYKLRGYLRRFYRKTFKRKMEAWDNGLWFFQDATDLSPDINAIYLYNNHVSYSDRQKIINTVNLDPRDSKIASNVNKLASKYRK